MILGALQTWSHPQSDAGRAARVRPEGFSAEILQGKRGSVSESASGDKEAFREAFRSAQSEWNRRASNRTDAAPEVRGRILDYAHGSGEKNRYFRLAKDGIVSYNGATFLCDTRTNTLCLGDCTDESRCIRVGLSGGGSLLFNRDQTDNLARAITMFDSEDQKRILYAIQMDKMAQKALEEIDEAENAAPAAQTDPEEAGREDEGGGA